MAAPDEAAVAAGLLAEFRSWFGKREPSDASMRASVERIIATGGLAELVAKETKVIDIIAPWLTLDGLRLIWELNQ